MSYTALYRKFRPTRFEDVKGQEHIVTTLKNQMKAERIGHAYLFCGSRGTGKTTIAKIFARAVNCENPQDGNPCGECPTCRAIASGASMNVIEIDAASNNGVDNIREIVDEVSYSPAQGKYKVYIIDEVHMLSIGAFNALLKTLEEPPYYVIFILATTEVHKIPITILSRCQRYDFKRISIETITEHMRELMQTEAVDVEDKALRYIAKAADGSMRDALSLLDQCIAFHLGAQLTYDKVLDVLGAVDTSVFSRLLRLLIDKNIIGAIGLLEEMIMQGREMTQFVADFTWYLRNLLLAGSSDAACDVIDMSSDNLHNLQEEAKMLEPPVVMRYIRIFSELSDRMRYASQKRVLLEMTIIKLCRPEMETQKDALLDRIRSIEKRFQEGVAVSAQNTPSAGAITDAGAAASGVKKRPALPKAIPEDIKKLVDKWQSVVGSTQMPMKQYLREARLTLGGDNRLVIVFADGIGSDYFLKQPEHMEQLNRLLSDSIGKEVEASVQTIKEDRNFDDTYVDLEAVIHMEIEEEL
ncbi:MAG: DNA polymerase III subunit gamma/tau [Lachnospiraceae bacterium]|nr:DNA polymerase III subunit gamma/tau [Lachnospiraceae bacterium]